MSITITPSLVISVVFDLIRYRDRVDTILVVREASEGLPFLLPPAPADEAPHLDEMVAFFATPPGQAILILHGLAEAYEQFRLDPRTIDNQAIAATRLAIGDLPGSVNLIHAGHESMSDHIAADHRGRVRAVTFNLGYLPGGDHALTTTVASTLAAVKSAMAVVDVQGIIAIVCYRHPEGELELQALRELATGLDQRSWVVTETTFLNQRGKPPLVLTILRQC